MTMGGVAWRRSLAFVVVVALAGSTLMAQEAGRQAAAGRGARPGGPAAEAASAGELERLFDRLEVTEARRALGLSEDQYLNFAQRLRRLQTLRAQHRMRRMALLRQLRGASAASTPAAEQTALENLAAFDQLQVDQARELLRAQAVVDEVLTLDQRIQFRLFQERFERRKLNLIGQARGAAGPP